MRSTPPTGPGIGQIHLHRCLVLWGTYFRIFCSGFFSPPFNAQPKRDAGGLSAGIELVPPGQIHLHRCLVLWGTYSRIFCSSFFSPLFNTQPKRDAGGLSAGIELVPPGQIHLHRCLVLWGDILSHFLLWFFLLSHHTLFPVKTQTIFFYIVIPFGAEFCLIIHFLDLFQCLITLLFHSLKTVRHF